LSQTSVQTKNNKETTSRKPKAKTSGIRVTNDNVVRQFSHAPEGSDAESRSELK
jgi:hypothetical protein